MSARGARSLLSLRKAVRGPLSVRSRTGRRAGGGRWQRDQRRFTRRYADESPTRAQITQRNARMSAEDSAPIAGIERSRSASTGPSRAAARHDRRVERYFLPSSGGVSRSERFSSASPNRIW